MLYVIENNKVIALIGVKDIIRENAKKFISKLNDLNIQTIMLSGDNQETSKIIAESLNIKNIISNVLPNEKANEIKKLMNENKNVMMVGDGINDASALVTANIGVSMNSATDIAGDSSDVILMNDNLERIIDLINISKKTIINIKQNLFWAFFYNLLMIPIAIGVLKSFGISMNPMFASFSMMISSLCVVLNALRLRK